MSLSILYPVHSGELDEERCSLALGAREADATPVGLHDISRHCEAETRARYTAGSGVSAKEFRKDLRLLAQRDAHALVPHPNPHRPVLLVGADLDDAALRRVLDRVRDQVSDHLP